MAPYRSAFIACLLLIGACTQDEGEACQVDSDCDDGLICSISGLRGTCRTHESTDDSGTPTETDASVSRDASVRDAAVRDGAIEDSAVSDSAVSDSAVEDSAVEDGAIPDSAAPDDDAG